MVFTLAFFPVHPGQSAMQVYNNDKPKFEETNKLTRPKNLSRLNETSFCFLSNYSC